MIWSVTAAPSPSIADSTVTEPENLSAYATLADAAPIQFYLDHQVRQIPLGPAIAHSTTEVSLPSAASSIAWLVDGGLVNGIHGTTTGAKVPTEASAQQPGGDPEAEFLIAGGPIGNGNFMDVRTGRAYASARHSDEPRGYGNSFINSVSVLPAAGSPHDPPGTFDPDARYPGGPDGTDPNPQGQMAILAIGQIASTSESIREGSTVISTAVAELKDINIGNRTSDNRCTNCVRIDGIRVEAYAEANGQPGGARAAYRVLLGRACRRAFDAETGRELDRCLPLDPRAPESNNGLQSINELEALNEQFQEPIWTQIPGAGLDYVVGIRITAGSEHEDPSRRSRTSDPPQDPHRNYAYPGKADRDRGQVAKAVAEGPDIEVWTITVTQAVDDARRRIKGTPAETILEQIDEDDQAPGIQITAPGPAGDQTGTQTIPIETIRSVRRLHFTMGVARANATARPLEVPDLGGTGGPSTVGGATPGAPGFAPGTSGAGSTVGTTPAGGAFGPFRLAFDWASFRIAPWAPGDMAKGIGIAGIGGGAVWLLRRRLALGA